MTDLKSLLASCYCNKISKIINLKGGKVNFGSQFVGFSSVYGLLAPFLLGLW
jgi:hypothetical protein